MKKTGMGHSAPRRSNARDQRRWRSAPSVAGLVLVACIAAGSSPSFAVTRESFESARSTWKMVEKNGPANVLEHRRSFDRPHSGQACELIRLQCGRATKVYFAHEISASRVISELAPSVWVRADRPGIQFLVRVVLPNTKAPNHDGPLTTVLHGSFYTDVGSWQKLSVPDTEKSLSTQLPILRSNFGSHVSAKGAYVDLVILNAYTEPGPITLAVDDLEVAGFVAAQQLRSGRPSPDSGARRSTNRSGSEPIRMKGSVLEVNQRPIFVRGIQHNGEPLSWLHSIGFNVVELKSPPSPEQVREAKQLGLWLIAPPPQVSGRSRIGDEYGQVLSWSLGHKLVHGNLEESRRLAADVRRADPLRSRPITAAPTSHLWEYSRFAHILRLDHPSIGTTFDSKDRVAWIRSRARLVRGRTCLWVGVPTEMPKSLVDQVSALAPMDAAALIVEPEQIRQLAFEALAAGARGLIFQSRARLDGRSLPARLRRSTLQLLNIELTTLEPWVAGGSYAGEIETGLQDVKTSVLETTSSRLMLILRTLPNQQYAPRVPNRLNLSILDTGSTSAAVAYGISPAAGLKTVTHWQKPGGVRIKLDEFRGTTAVVLSPDPLVRRFLAEQTGRQAKLAAELQREIATRYLEAFDSTVNRLVQLGVQALGDPRLNRVVLGARQALGRSKRLLNSNDYESADELARQSQLEVSRARYVIWQQAARGFRSPSVSPFCRSFATLPVHWQVARQLSSAQWSTNRLPGGNCEELAAMRRQGWQYHKYADADLFTAVALNPEAAFSGRHGLRLNVWSDEASEAPAVVESAPAWITTAPVAVRRGQLIRIHGRAKIKSPIRGSYDGLMVFDTIGGMDLAERIKTNESWSEFTLYRVATRDTDLRVTFALSGIGEVWLDDITVQLMDGSNRSYSASTRSR